MSPAAPAPMMITSKAVGMGGLWSGSVALDMGAPCQLLNAAWSAECPAIGLGKTLDRCRPSQEPTPGHRSARHQGMTQQLGISGQQEHALLLRLDQEQLVEWIPML